MLASTDAGHQEPLSPNNGFCRIDLRKESKGSRGAYTQKEGLAETGLAINRRRCVCVRACTYPRLHPPFQKKIKIK